MNYQCNRNICAADINPDYILFDSIANEQLAMNNPIGGGQI